ncbi:MAG: glycosyltransferase [Bacteroidota bacterium]
MADQKKVLIVTYYWPPSSGPGVQRWLKFVKYLSRLGYTPIIFTVKKASVPNLDHSLENDIPGNTIVHKTRAYEPDELYYFLSGNKNKKPEVGLAELKNVDSPIKKLAKFARSNVFIPDAKIGWYYGNRKKLLKLVRKEGIQTVITTGPPHTTHLFGDYLKRKNSIKWLVDFRDPWTGLYYEQLLSRTKRSQQINRDLERRVLENADQVIVVSKGVKEEFKDFEHKIEIIYNGYDEDDLLGLSPDSSEKFELTYTGNFKANQDVEELWKAIAELSKENSQFKNNFVVRLVGNINVTVKESIKYNGMEHMVSYEQFVPHLEALALMIRSSLLLLPIPKAENNKLILTGKIFEYMASCSRILSIGPIGGDADIILRDCQRAPMIDYEDKEMLKQRLLKEFTSWYEGNKAAIKHLSTNHKKYSREALTHQLAKYIT